MPRPRTPTNILELKGAFEKNPARRRPDEPKPEGQIGAAPRYLKAREKKVYDEIVQAAAPGVLTSSDVSVVVIAARLEAEWRYKGEDFASSKIGQLIKAYSQIGFTPADRSKISVKSTKKKVGKFDEF